MALSIPQQTIASSTARFRSACCGRRFGKSFLAIREMAKFARLPKQKVWYVSPTYRMSKQNLWSPLKERLSAVRWIDKINEADLSVTLKNGSVIALRGADNPDSLRGVGLNFLVLDEAADIREETWSTVLRPTLADTGGHALFLGTPKGRNWFYDIWLKGYNGEEEWASWQYSTIEGGNVSEKEIETSRRDMDELTFDQEYNASFLNFEGRVYYPFTIKTHCAPLEYNPRAPLILCFDYNVEPGVAIVCQEMRLPNGLDGTGVIGEVHIPRNSNTPAVCRKLLLDWGDHQGEVRLYGDATGAARGSSRVQGSDWDLVQAELRPVFRDRLVMRVPPANPAERSRVNAVNSRLQNAAGEIRLIVDPTKAQNLIRDLEGVRLLKGGSGEIDKRIDPKLTHASDSLGYYLSKEFPITNNKVRIGSFNVGP